MQQHCETHGVGISDEKEWNDINYNGKCHNVKNYLFRWNGITTICVNIYNENQKENMKGCNFSKDFTTFRIGNIYWYK